MAQSCVSNSVKHGSKDSFNGIKMWVTLDTFTSRTQRTSLRSHWQDLNDYSKIDKHWITPHVEYRTRRQRILFPSLYAKDLRIAYLFVPSFWLSSCKYISVLKCNVVASGEVKWRRAKKMILAMPSSGSCLAACTNVGKSGRLGG